LLEGGYGTVKNYPGPWIFTTEGVYELPAESVYWSGGTSGDRGEMLSPDVPKCTCLNVP